MLPGKFHMLNYSLLMQEYEGIDSMMVKKGIEVARTHFNLIKPYIERTIDCYKNYGEIVDKFIRKDDGTLLPYTKRFFRQMITADPKVNALDDDKLDKVMNGFVSKYSLTQPYENDWVDMSWLKKFLKFKTKIAKTESKSKT